MSCGMVCANPPSTDPSVKITIATWYSSFLLNRSASLPQIGVVAVEVSNIAVTTHAYWLCVPSRSARIVGSALETTVDDRIATSNASNNPVNALSTCRCDIGRSGGCPAGGGTGSASDTGRSGVDVAGLPSQSGNLFRS